MVLIRAVPVKWWGFSKMAEGMGGKDSEDMDRYTVSKWPFQEICP